MWGGGGGGGGGMGRTTGQHKPVLANSKVYKIRQQTLQNINKATLKMTYYLLFIFKLNTEMGTIKRILFNSEEIESAIKLVISLCDLKVNISFCLSSRLNLVFNKIYQRSK